MELFQAQDNFIILNGPHSLWCNRLDGRIQPRFGVDLGEAWSLKCRGIVYGIIGKIQFFPGADWRLLVISKRTLLGSLPGDHQVYRIDRVAVLTLSSSESPEADLDLCEQHQSGGRGRKLLGVGGGGLGGVDNQQKGLGQTWSKIKTAASNMKEKNVKDRDLKDKEKLERRFVEELLKMFSDSESFYYSPTGDLTNTLQRQFSGKHNTGDPLWKRCDKRFFWNEFMVKDLLSSEDPHSSHWIIPVIQGYCKIAHCINTFVDDDVEEGEDKVTAPFPPEDFDLVLISRRSVYRAGTRYRRRGVDDNGDVANYVETEQIVCTATHNVSFVQVRGSVPVYWSQPGYKYRPPPRLDKDEKETQLAFRKHFDHQLELYKTVAVISLVDQSGREKIINDVFMDNILAYNSPFLSYITFDFHEYCRGMRFENVSVLVESIPEVIKDVRYCWTDAKGIICDQRGVFRVNCMDCLDRTNVVQAALARHIMEQQLLKLGKLLPDQILPASIRTAFQEMWASNGDAISRQYAGTAAMKGDFTRTGERKFTGVMKDGYNSANRYYLNRFKAAYRQTLIDMMLDNPVTEDISALIAAMKNGPEEEQWTMEREECVAQLVQHCTQLLLPDEEEHVGGWALVDPYFSPDGEITQDQDVILLLTYHAYYVASYDDEAEKITQYERIALEDLEKIEIGFEGAFKSKHLFIRIYRKHQGNSGYFHTLRTIQHRTAEDARSVLLCIADAFASARASIDLGLKVAECRLDRKKSKQPPSVTQISSKSRLTGWSKPSSTSKAKSGAERKTSEPSFASHHRSRLGGLRTSLSDTCLVARRLEDVSDEFKTSNSAPQSYSGSSASDEDDDSGETEDMERYNLTIATTTQEGGVGQEALSVDEKETNGVPEEGKSGGDEHQDKDLETGPTQGKLDNKSELTLEEGETSKECEFVVGDATEEGEQIQENVEVGNSLEGSAKAEEGEENVLSDTVISQDSKSESHIEVEKNALSLDVLSAKEEEEKHVLSETLILQDSESESQIEVEKGALSLGVVSAKEEEEEEKTILGETVVLQDSETESQSEVEQDSSFLGVMSAKEKGEETVSGETVVSPDSESQNEVEKDVSSFGVEENNVTENKEEEKEVVSGEQQKLKDSDSNKLGSKENDSTEQHKEENGDVRPKKLHKDDLQITFNKTTASLRVSQSSGELGTMTSTGSDDTSEGTPEKRRFGSRFLNRSPSANRVPKMNIFATAQARGRTLIPELRSKLSSFSQQVRSRSPGLKAKRPGLHSELNVEQKQRRRKCRTRIIEL